MTVDSTCGRGTAAAPPDQSSQQHLIRSPRMCAAADKTSCCRKPQSVVVWATAAPASSCCPNGVYGGAADPEPSLPLGVGVSKFVVIATCMGIVQQYSTAIQYKLGCFGLLGHSHQGRPGAPLAGASWHLQRVPVIMHTSARASRAAAMIPG